MRLFRVWAGGVCGQSMLNFELIEHLLSYILRTERTHGPQALVGQVVAAGQSRLGKGQLGAVLVFLPGMAEIRKCARFLQVCCITARVFSHPDSNPTLAVTVALLGPNPNPCRTRCGWTRVTWGRYGSCRCTAR